MIIAEDLHEAIMFFPTIDASVNKAVNHVALMVDNRGLLPYVRRELFKALGSPSRSSAYECRYGDLLIHLRLAEGNDDDNYSSYDKESVVTYYIRGEGEVLGSMTIREQMRVAVHLLKGCGHLSEADISDYMVSEYPIILHT